MQSKNLSPFHFRVLAKAGGVILVMASALLLAYAQVPSKYANDTFTVITRNDHGRIHMHLDGRGDHCWATTSDDRGVGISMGDDLCTSEAEDVSDAALLWARVMPAKISFRMSGKSYSITDPATVKNARALFDPLLSIEAQQSELGAKQRALGEKQSELGHQQREVKVKVPDMSADFEKIEADVQRLSSQGGTQDELGNLQSKLGDLQSRIGDLQSQAGDAQSRLGDQQSDLGEQQSRFGDQQSALGDKAQTLAVDIAGKLRATLTQAINSGAAKPE
ncbi:MAG TPA: hypothetical protein VFY05_03235 [Candidatus Angelobacter sp.]|nr:hypothetical protein [Candidatus Angelobacter sp.]